MKWVKFIEERYGPKPPSQAMSVYKAATQHAVDLAKQHEWDSHSIHMTSSSLLLSYVKTGRLYVCRIPITLIRKTLTIKPHLELCLKKHAFRDKKEKKNTCQMLA